MSTPYEELSRLSAAAIAEKPKPPKSTAPDKPTLRMLRPVIAELRAKSFSWNDIQKWLAEKGYKFSTTSITSSFNLSGQYKVRPGAGQSREVKNDGEHIRAQ